MAAKKITAKAENQENKELETQSTQDGKNVESGTPDTSTPETEGDTPNREPDQDARSESENPQPAGDSESAPAATVPAPQDDEAEGEVLSSLEELQMQFRTPGWQHAALTRYQGWEPGKKVTKTEYAKALKAISNRPQGGGRVV